MSTLISSIPLCRSPSPIHHSDLLAPPPLIDTNIYPRTPSLISTTTTADSTDRYATPPNTAAQARSGSPLSNVADRPKSVPIETVFRSSTDSTRAQQHRSKTTSPTPLPSRPARAPMRSLFSRSQSPLSNSQDGVSVISASSSKRVGMPSRSQSPSSAFILDGHQSWLVALCSRHRVLAGILQYIDFADFHGICCTSKAMRGILADPQARDVILSRFVTGYRQTSSNSRQTGDEIRVDLCDLEALMLSQAIPLHIYPQNALDILSGLCPTESTSRLRHFTDIHSRFVLLLRQRAPTLNVLSDLDDPHWRFGGSTELSALRELTFPPPLSYPETHPPRSKENQPPPSPDPSSSQGGPARKKRCRFPLLNLFSSNNTGRSPATPSYPRPPPLHHTGGRHDTYPAFSDHLVEKGKGAVDTLLRKYSTKLPPPPPEYTPKALKDHRRRSRRQSLVGGSYSVQRSSMNPVRGMWEKDSVLFSPPRAAHLRANSLPASSSSNSNSLSEMSLPRLSSSTPSPLLPVNPHDIALAPSRSRAPVCRTFVPCTEFSHPVLLACEGQLFAAGLWVLLKPGDVIINLGFVPSKDGANTNVEALPTSGWLVFTGKSLHPYYPPEPAPINGLTLPSSMYYNHLLQPFANPRFFITIPPAPKKRLPELTLANLTSSMRSPATKVGVAGVVKVRKYTWVGKVDGSEIISTWAQMAGSDAASEFWGLSSGALAGGGWHVDWVVEAEGTKEGRAGLLMALDPSEPEPQATEWEIVRERCNRGRLWMRLIVIPPPTESSDSLGVLRQ